MARFWRQLLAFEFLNLQYDEDLINALEQGVGETGIAI
jgi:hypothetical protein